MRILFPSIYIIPFDMRKKIPSNSRIDAGCLHKYGEKGGGVEVLNLFVVSGCT